MSSCKPTPNCGAGCYAHDGRDREFNQIVRGAINYFLAVEYERSSEAERREIEGLLAPSFDRAVKEAKLDAERSASEGFERAPRVRLSHVGDMAATPAFTNMVARELSRRLPDLSCTIYTRHPSAHLLDQQLMVINLTVEGDRDPRWKYVPEGARVVSSAWDGEVSLRVDVNFLEHHVEKSLAPKSAGRLCPVTVDHHAFPSCDSARCSRCFSKHKHPTQRQSEA